jgi:DNA-binding SARP family transcriptional activator
MSLGLLSSLAKRRDGPIVHLFGRPYVSHGGNRWDIAEGGKRLLAFLALHRGHLERRYVAGCLWPTVDDGRAAGNLRSALWRLKSLEVPLIETEKPSLRLRDEVGVDAHLLGDWAARVISGDGQPEDMSMTPWDLDDLELLPGWYDDWVIVGRERLRQRLLHAVENLSRELARGGRCAEAVEAAMVVVSAEPFRESAHRVLMEAHLAEGNWVEARRRFEDHSETMRRELGVEPSPSLAALIHPDPVTQKAGSPSSSPLRMSRKPTGIEPS